MSISEKVRNVVGVVGEALTKERPNRVVDGLLSALYQGVAMGLVPRDGSGRVHYTLMERAKKLKPSGKRKHSVGPVAYSLAAAVGLGGLVGLVAYASGCEKNDALLLATSAITYSGIVGMGNEKRSY